MKRVIPNSIQSVVILTIVELRIIKLALKEFVDLHTEEEVGKDQYDAEWLLGQLNKQKDI